MIASRKPAPGKGETAERLAPIELDDARLDAVHGGIIEPVCAPVAPTRGIKDGTSNTR